MNYIRFANQKIAEVFNNTKRIKVEELDIDEKPYDLVPRLEEDPQVVGVLAVNTIGKLVTAHQLKQFVKSYSRFGLDEQPTIGYMHRYTKLRESFNTHD